MDMWNERATGEGQSEVTWTCGRATGEGQS